MNIQQEIKTGFQAWIDYPARARSGEHDFGVQWTIDGNPRSYPHWQVSWIESTGELYAVDLGRTGCFILIANFPDEEAVELALEGWVDLSPNLPALIAQARSGAKAPRPEYAPESGSAFDLSDLDLSSLDNVPVSAEQIGAEAAVCVLCGGKAYRGYRAGDDEIGACRMVVVSSDGRNKMISSPLHHVVRHSPSGFEWGYAGSGPADTSLSILADYFGERPTKDDVYYGRGKAVHPALYQQFKRDFITSAPKEGFTITSDQIKDWLAEHARGRVLPPAGETPGEEE